MDVEKELRRIARELLKRHPLSRGPYVITDDDLRQFLGMKTLGETDGQAVLVLWRERPPWLCHCC